MISSLRFCHDIRIKKSNFVFSLSPGERRKKPLPDLKNFKRTVYIVEGSMSAYLYTVFCMCQPLRCPAGGDERTKYLSAALYVAILPVQQDSRLHLLLYTAPRLLIIIIYAGQLLFQRRIHYSRRIKTE